MAINERQKPQPITSLSLDRFSCVVPAAMEEKARKDALLTQLRSPQGLPTATDVLGRQVRPASFEEIADTLYGHRFSQRVFTDKAPTQSWKKTRRERQGR